MNPRTLETKYPNVYAIGDIANTGTPKAGVFAEGAAKAVASSPISRIAGKGESHLYGGAGSCYIEFGGERVGRVDVDFFSGPKPTGVYYEPSSRAARGQECVRGDTQGALVRSLTVRILSGLHPRGGREEQPQIRISRKVLKGGSHTQSSTPSSAGRWSSSGLRLRTDV